MNDLHQLAMSDVKGARSCDAIPGGLWRCPSARRVNRVHFDIEERGTGQ